MIERVPSPPLNSTSSLTVLSLTVESSSTLSGAVSLGSTLSAVSGASQLAGLTASNVGVGTFSATGYATITGLITGQAGLAVSSATTLTGAVSLGGALSAVSGASSLAGLTSSATTHTSLIVNSATTLTGPVSFGGALSAVSGASILAALTSSATAVTSLTVSSAVTFSGITKVLDQGDFIIQNQADTTKQLEFNLSGQTTGKLVTISSLLTTTQIIQIPNITATDTLATLGLSQTLSGINTFSNATDASSSTVAALVVSGGLAVAKSAQIGTTITGYTATAVTAGSAAVDLQNGDTSAYGGVISQIKMEYGGAGKGFAHWLQSAHSGTVGSGNGVRLYLNTGASAGTSTQPGTGNALIFEANDYGVNITPQTQTTNGQSFLNVTGTWNNAAAVFVGLKFNVVNTASSAGSYIIDLQTSGVSQWHCDPSGNVTGIGIWNCTNTTSATTSLLGAVVIGNGTAATSVAIGGGKANIGGTLAVAGACTLDTGANGSSFGGKLTISGNLVMSGGNADGNVSSSSWTTTGSSTIAAGVLTILNSNAATIASYTLTMPAAPAAGQMIQITSAGIVTTFTLSANAGQTISNAPSALAAGVGVQYIYSGTNWYRIQ
jgi:hypothetical protein